jgi:hypothetical protein
MSAATEERKAQRRQADQERRAAQAKDRKTR